MAMRIQLFCALALLPLCATAGTDDHKPAIAACTAPAQAAIAAAQLRDAGKPKFEVESTLPERQQALQTPTGRMIYAALDDAYEFADVSVFSHYYYAMYTCMLQGDDKPGPVSFKAAHAGVLACQSRHATGTSAELGRCLMGAIDAASSPPAGL